LGSISSIIIQHPTTTKDGMLMLLTREHNYADASIVCRSPTLFSGNSASANPPIGKDHLAVA
jgi:hypothetical protein